MLKAVKRHYHWVIALLAFLETIVFGGLLNSANVFVIPVCETFQETRGNYSLAQVPYNMVCFLSSMATGYVFNRFGYKKSAIFSLILITGSLVLTAVSQNLLVYGISKAIMAVGYGVCLTAGTVRIVKDWFWKHQGLVVGAISMATGFGGSLMSIVLTDIIGRSGWRAANFFAAVLMALIAASFLLLKNRPEEMGLKPFGYGQPQKKIKKARAEDHDWPGYSLKELLKHPVFYIMIFCTFGACLFLYMCLGVVVMHFQDVGYSPAEAANFQSVMMLCLAVAKLLAGGLCDKIGPKPVSIICMVCGVVGMLIMSVMTDPLWCYIGVSIFAVSLSMTSIMIPLLAAPLFGYRACITVNGIFLSMSSLANMIANPASNILYDRIGSYIPVFRGAALGSAVLVVVYLILFAAAKADKNRYFRQEAKNKI